MDIQHLVKFLPAEDEGFNGYTVVSESCGLTVLEYIFEHNDKRGKSYWRLYMNTEGDKIVDYSTRMIFKDTLPVKFKDGVLTYYLYDTNPELYEAMDDYLELYIYLYNEALEVSYV